MGANYWVLRTDLDLRFLPPEILSVVERVAAQHGIEWRKLFGKRRTKRIAAARQQVYSELHATGKFSTTRIGNIFGRDHSTVVYGIKTHRKKCGL